LLPKTYTNDFSKRYKAPGQENNVKHKTLNPIQYGNNNHIVIGTHEYIYIKNKVMHQFRCASFLLPKASIYFNCYNN